MAHKTPKWAIIMHSKTNSAQNKPVNKREGTKCLWMLRWESGAVFSFFFLLFFSADDNFAALFSFAETLEAGALFALRE